MSISAVAGRAHVCRRDGSLSTRTGYETVFEVFGLTSCWRVRIFVEIPRIDFTISRTVYIRYRPPCEESPSLSGSYFFLHAWAVSRGNTMIFSNLTWDRYERPAGVGRRNFRKVRFRRRRFFGLPITSNKTP